MYGLLIHRKDFEVRDNIDNTYIDLTVFIKDGEIIKLEEGDLLIVRVKGYVTRSERDSIDKYLGKTIPKNIKYILCSDSLEFKAYRPPKG